MPASNDPTRIRITASDTRRPEVDDFLKRQQSLRGETNISYGKRAWYYQSWFVAMVLAAIGAFAAWLVIEPSYDDYAYAQGTISQIDLGAFPPAVIGEGENAIQFDGTLRGAIEIAGRPVWLYRGICDLQDHDERILFDISTLRVGQEVGVFVEYYWSANDEVAIARYIDTAPPEKKPAKAQLSFADQMTRSHTMGLLIFGIVAAFIGLALGAADGIVCRLPRRALMAGGIGLLVGFLGGFVSGIIADLIYAPLNAIANRNTGDGAGGMNALGFILQMGGRGLAWSVGGMAMGLGQGLALRSSRLVLYGFLGGAIGGLLGGLLFDPIDLLLFGNRPLTTQWSRAIGFVTIGAAVGAMTGIVELFARDCWLRMLKGPLAGKEFVVFKDVMRIGASPRSEIFLFNDALVEESHATLRAVGENYEIENLSRRHPTTVNGRPITRTRLRHGDKISIGTTEFVYESRS